MSDHPFWLSDAQFARLKPLLPNKVRGVPRVDDRRVISGIVHVIRNGHRRYPHLLDMSPEPNDDVGVRGQPR